MTETRGEYNAGAARDDDLAGVLTPQQEMLLTASIAEVLALGYGEVTIHIREGRIWTVRVTRSHDAR
jgi:hypothetical protein